MVFAVGARLANMAPAMKRGMPMAAPICRVATGKGGGADLTPVCHPGKNSSKTSGCMEKRKSTAVSTKKSVVTVMDDECQPEPDQKRQDFHASKNVLSPTF